MTELPAFHIVVSEELINEDLSLIHRLGTNTIRICKDVKPAVELVESVSTTKPKEITFDEEPPKNFYSRIASELSTLDNQQLLSHFSGIRVSHKITRSERRYQFKFGS
ncbi:MAG: hypothetical protein ABI772_00725 [Bacteroidota bacterium]